VSTHDVILLRTEAVLERTALSRSRLYELLRAGSFPAPRKLANSNTNIWSDAEVAAWIQQQLGKES
jgi:predicted DNA-binding transcriptional regulator AlpA